MADLEIDVYRDGNLLKQISRPIRPSPGGATVTYRGRPYIVLPGNRIEIGESLEPSAEGVQRASNGYSPLPPAPNQEVVPIHNESSLIPTAGDWDTEQLRVIEAVSTARLIVDAGPGTGKTAVACARVAHLMSLGVEPAGIWLISFTRTAVREIRDRIQKLSGTDTSAAAVRITTLDSHVWYLRQGFEEDVERRVFPGYEESIAEVVRLLKRRDEAVAEYLSSVEHLIVDEAQDFVGCRAELVSLLIDSLSPGCGVTVFTDDAQAIYGFTEADKEDGLCLDTRTLPERLRTSIPGGFVSVSLREVHRTRSPSLLRIFSSTRDIVLQSRLPGHEMLEAVKAEVREFADMNLDYADRSVLAGARDTLVLYRGRAEAFTASSYLLSDGIAHRLRMSGLPHALSPWIARLFWDHMEPYMVESRFAELWAARVEMGAGPHLSSEVAWRRLYELSGRPGKRLEMAALRNKLSRSQPPIMLCSPEFGTEGPIVGTIHGSKGREADTVHLMLSTNVDEDGDLQEEARVVFVGASRARRLLKVGSGLRYPGGTLESGRAYRSSPKPRRRQLEIGRGGDLDVRDQVSRRFHPTPESAIAQQEYLAGLCSFPFKVIARADRASDFRYGLYHDDSRCLATLALTFNQELMRIGHSGSFGPNDKKLHPTMTINNIHVIGTRTIVIPQDDPCLEQLREPFDRTGVFLAPLIIGFPVVYFNPYG
jgi:hypothetical protein